MVGDVVRVAGLARRTTFSATYASRLLLFGIAHYANGHAIRLAMMTKREKSLANIAASADCGTEYQ